MISFASDYLEGAHPAILARLLETNAIQTPGYGTDPFCERARAKLRAACGDPDADVFFISGGTQTNAIVISAMLAPYQGVFAAETGHINGHEAGAIEATGHRVLPLPQTHGKFTAETLTTALERFFSDGNHAHMVQPGMVYLSQPTEYGTLYTKAELSAIRAVCDRYKLPLFMDGARLGYGLAAPENDLFLSDIANLCDVFYIGGTKVGALCGEAVIFPHHGAPAHFFTTIKQRGALLAKGRLLGLQFDTLFTDDLYYKLGAHAIKQATRLEAIFSEKGYRFFLPSPTNQKFIVLDNATMERLSATIGFSFWERYDDHHTVVRFATSWATTDAQLDALKNAL